MKVIGLTGGTGTGKTTALRVIEKMGGVGVDADAVYHDLLENSYDMKYELSRSFPAAVRGGVVDRKKLGEIVFKSDILLQTLNKITHKYVIADIKDTIKAEEAEGREYFVIDAVELIESGCGDLCDYTVAVTAPKDIRIKRIMAREGIDERYAALRVNAQKSDEYYHKKCDYLLINDFETQEKFEEYCTEFFRKLLEK